MVLDRITSNPEVLGGQPCIRGLRMPVHRVLSMLRTFGNREELLYEHPSLENEDIDQALAFVERDAAG